jgi:hypothetical protein
LQDIQVSHRWVPEAIEDGGAYLKGRDLAVEIAHHHPLAEQLETAHFGFHQAASMVAGSLLPYPTTKVSQGMQDGVAGVSAWSTVFPGLAVFACWNNGLCAA